MDTNVLLNLKRMWEIKQSVQSAICSKEFREQAVKQLTEETLSPKEAARGLLMPFHFEVLVKGRADREAGRSRQNTMPADRDWTGIGQYQTETGGIENRARPRV